MPCERHSTGNRSVHLDGSWRRLRRMSEPHRLSASRTQPGGSGQVGWSLIAGARRT